MEYPEDSLEGGEKKTLNVLSHLCKAADVRKVKEGRGTAPSGNKGGTATRANLVDAIVRARQLDSIREYPVGQLLIEVGDLPEDLNDKTFNWGQLKNGLIKLLQKWSDPMRTKLQRRRCGLKGVAKKKAVAQKGNVLQIKIVFAPPTFFVCSRFICRFSLYLFYEHFVANQGCKFQNIPGAWR